jgi:hypothetical protein
MGSETPDPNCFIGNLLLLFCLKATRKRGTPVPASNPDDEGEETNILDMGIQALLKPEKCVKLSTRFVFLRCHCLTCENGGSWLVTSKAVDLH